MASHATSAFLILYVKPAWELTEAGHFLAARGSTAEGVGASPALAPSRKRAEPHVPPPAHSASRRSRVERLKIFAPLKWVSEWAPVDQIQCIGILE